MINLFYYQDLKYKEFNDKILNDKSIKTIGIRVPILKKIAKEISKSDYKEYFSKKEYMEDILLHGLILGYLKISFSSLLNLLDNFIPLVNNWEVNDTVCSNLKIFKSNQEEGYKYILKLLKGNNWSKRFGLVLLLNHYLNDNYIDNILDICSNMKSDDYYVNMANSWLISYCFMKYKKKTIVLYHKHMLDDFVNNKSISKICDSYRVSKEEKEMIKKYRR